jgi:hypothetical protein
MAAHSSKSPLQLLQEVTGACLNISEVDELVKPVKKLFGAMVRAAKGNKSKCTVRVGAPETPSGKKLNTLRRMGFSISLMAKDATAKESESHIYIVSWAGADLALANRIVADSESEGGSVASGAGSAGAAAAAAEVGYEVDEAAEAAAGADPNGDIVDTEEEEEMVQAMNARIAAGAARQRGRKRQRSRR